MLSPLMSIYQTSDYISHSPNLWGDICYKALYNSKREPKLICFMKSGGGGGGGSSDILSQPMEMMGTCSVFPQHWRPCLLLLKESYIWERDFIVNFVWNMTLIHRFYFLSYAFDWFANHSWVSQTGKHDTIVYFRVENGSCYTPLLCNTSGRCPPGRLYRRSSCNTYRHTISLLYQLSCHSSVQSHWQARIC